jgi:hypothetical protein
MSAAIMFVLIFFGQTVGGHYGDLTEKAWGWLLPTIVPSCTLIIGVLFKGFGRGEAENKSVRRSKYRFAYWLSFAYLFLVFLTIIFDSFTPWTTTKLMEMSNWWLGPFQGWVSVCLVKETQTNENKKS